MESIQWSDDLSTGIPAIDDQHRRIVAYINDLQQARCQQGVAEVLGELLDYTVSHFEFEETLMAQAGFDGLEEHKRTHDAFRVQIEAFGARHAHGEDISDELVDLLNRWLYQHIAEDDAGYASELRQRRAADPEAYMSWMQRLEDTVSQ
jgi:hemerythrin